jgi:RimJ/RimL family protein N-acetyltransferase
VVGTTRFCYIEFWDWEPGSPHQRGAHLPDALEIGYTWLSPAAQRTGINTEAKLLMLTHAFETWRVHRVRLTTDARNERSRKAIERLGAGFDGVLRAARTAFDGGIRDSAHYSILDSEWPEIKRALAKRLLPP